MSWAARRQALYLFGFLIFAGIFIALPAWYITYDPPTCFDGEQNGKEEGVDCGGECELVCPFTAADVIVHWYRAFEVTPGFYSAIAMLENPNISYEARDVPYEFKLRDAEGILIYETKGTLYVPPHARIPVVVTGLPTGERVVARAEFVLLREPAWVVASERPITLSVERHTISNEESAPRVDVVVRNTSVDAIVDQPVVIILFDAEGNALHVSRTTIDQLPDSAETILPFTWSQPLSAPIATVDVIPVVSEPVQ